MNARCALPISNAGAVIASASWGSRSAASAKSNMRPPPMPASVVITPAARPRASSGTSVATDAVTEIVGS